MSWRKRSKQNRSATAAASSKQTTVAGLGDLAKAMTSASFAGGGALVPEQFAGAPERGTKMPPATVPERGIEGAIDPDPDSELLDPQGEEELKKKPMTKGFNPNEPRASDGEWTSGTGHGYSKADAAKYGWTKAEHADANAHDKSSTRGGDSWHQEGSESPWAMKMRGHENGWTNVERDQATAAESEEDGSYMGRSVAWHDKHAGESWYKKDKSQAEERAQNLKAGYLTADVAKADTGDYGSKSDAGYADPGYQGDGKPRYPLKDGGELSPERIRAAWNYINKDKNAAQYSGDQVKKIKEKIISAWKAEIDSAGPPSAVEKAVEGEDLEKFNPYHDEQGKFTSSDKAHFKQDPNGPHEFKTSSGETIKGHFRQGPDDPNFKSAAELKAEARAARANAVTVSGAAALPSAQAGANRLGVRRPPNLVPSDPNDAAQLQHQYAHTAALKAGEPGTPMYNKAYTGVMSQYAAYRSAIQQGQVGSYAYNRAYQRALIENDPDRPNLVQRIHSNLESMTGGYARTLESAAALAGVGSSVYWGLKHGNLKTAQSTAETFGHVFSNINSALKGRATGAASSGSAAASAEAAAAGSAADLGAQAYAGSSFKQRYAQYKAKRGPLGKAWDEGKHPRAPAGSADGGEWVPDSGGANPPFGQPSLTGQITRGAILSHAASDLTGIAAATGVALAADKLLGGQRLRTIGRLSAKMLTGAVNMTHKALGALADEVGTAKTIGIVGGGAAAAVGLGHLAAWEMAADDSTLGRATRYAYLQSKFSDKDVALGAAIANKADGLGDLAKAFDESKHPRAADGEFAAGGGWLSRNKDLLTGVGMLAAAFPAGRIAAAIAPRLALRLTARHLDSSVFRQPAATISRLLQARSRPAHYVASVASALPGDALISEGVVRLNAASSGKPDERTTAQRVAEVAVPAAVLPALGVVPRYLAASIIRRKRA